MMKINKKGQAAMEFLMTYGWAILVVLVAIATLAYFGVLNPSKFLPSSCTVEPGISCDDFKVTADSITMVMQNGMGESVAAANIAYTGCTAAANQAWADSQQLTFTLTGCNPVLGAAGGKFKGTVTVTYTSSSGLGHSVPASIITQIE